jgi:hypothetical protein
MQRCIKVRKLKLRPHKENKIGFDRRYHTREVQVLVQEKFSEIGPRPPCASKSWRSRFDILGAPVSARTVFRPMSCNIISQRPAFSRWLALLWLLVVSGSPIGLQPVLASNAAARQPFLNQYCLPCHSQKLKTAGITLENSDPEHPASHAQVWEKVLGKLDSGEMPPAGRSSASWIPGRCRRRECRAPTQRRQGCLRQGLSAIWTTPLGKNHMQAGPSCGG